jgi:N-acetylmuramoyl-L-alanine amidase
MKVTRTLKIITTSLMLSLTSPALATTTFTATPVVADAQTSEPTVIATVKPIDTPASSQVDCLVKVMNHEAGGEGRQGQKAVGYVVMNRAKSGKFPNSVCGVVYQKAQFTNIRNAKAIPANKYSQLKTLALSIMSSYSRGNDPTNGSLYFHNKSYWPNWRNVIRTVSIGGHVFYKAR